MGELQDLITLKKEIQRRIDAIKNQTVKSGKVKLSLNTRQGRPDDWILSIDVENITENPKWDNIKHTYRTVICAHKRQDVIDRIQPLIDDLVGLKQKLEEAEYEEDEEAQPGTESAGIHVRA